MPWQSLAVVSTTLLAIRLFLNRHSRCEADAVFYSEAHRRRDETSSVKVITDAAARTIAIAIVVCCVADDRCMDKYQVSSVYDCAARTGVLSCPIW